MAGFSTNKGYDMCVQNGVKCIFFTGGYLQTKDGIIARGANKGGVVYIRADDPNFTATEIAGHEIGHELVRRGSLDMDAVISEVRKEYTKEELSKIVDDYGLDFLASGVNEDELTDITLEEITCDALGGMNAFASNREGNAEFIRKLQGLAEKHYTGKTGEGTFARQKGTEQKLSTVGRYDNLSEERLREIKMNWPLTWAFHNDILKSEDMIIINNEARNVFVDKTERDRYRVRRNVYAFPVTNGKTVFMSGSFANPVIDFVVEDIGTEHDILVNSLRRYASYARKNGNDKGTVPIIRRFFGTRGIVSHDRNDFSYDRWETVARSGANGSGISEENRSRESEVTSEKQKFSTVNSTQLALENPDVDVVESKQFKRWFGDWQNDPQRASKVVNVDGTPKVVYHQTAANITVFDNSHPVAGANDSETPNGFFFKENDHDIGLTGKRQMAVYLNMRKPLHFANREEANMWYQKNIPGYAQLQQEMQDKLDPVSKQMDAIEDQMFADDVSDERYDQLDQQWNDLLEEMKTMEDSMRGRLRGLLNDYFLNGQSGYDGIILDYDGHRYVNGQREDVKSYIVFDRTQIKSATDNVGTFDRSNPDVRYSTVNSTQLALENPDVYDEIQVTYDEILQKTNGKDLEAALLEEAQKHREDLQMWEHEAAVLTKLWKQSEKNEAKLSKALSERRDRIAEVSEELRERRRDVRTMENEFVRVVREWEKQTGKLEGKTKEAASLKQALKDSIREHRQDNAAWEREYDRLLKMYERSGRKIPLHVRGRAAPCFHPAQPCGG